MKLTLKVVPALAVIALALSCFQFAMIPVYATSSADDWPMYNHDAAHTGSSNNSVPNQPQLLWKFPSGALSCPVIADGYAYVNSGGILYCVNASNGQQVWQQNSSAPLVWDDCPAVSGGIVYTPNEVYNASTGQLLWNFSIKYQGNSPTVAEGAVYIGYGDYLIPGALFAFNATNGAQMWNFSAWGSRSAFTTPTVANGIIYCAIANDVIYAFNATTGAQLWNITSIGSAYSQITFDKGFIYFDGSECVYCLDASTGTILQTYKLNAPYRHVTVAEGMIYIGNYAFNASTGIQLWMNPKIFGTLGDPDLAGGSALAFANGTLYITNYYTLKHGLSGQKFAIHSFNASTGAEIWNYTFPGNYDSYTISSPIIAYGKIYVGVRDGLYCFGAAELNLTPASTLTLSPSPSATIPEFSSMALLLVALAATLTLVVLKKKHDTNNACRRAC